MKLHTAKLSKIQKGIGVFLLSSSFVLVSPFAEAKNAFLYDPPNVVPPQPTQEFRGVWIATVGNIDWPSRSGLTTAQQKAELMAMLDRAVELKLNAVIFQVRPDCDALYDSKYEPWSVSLTGQMGKAPAPYYDPLAFAVAEAHKRGLELHAWFNPYRGYYAQARSEISDNHISKTHPEWVKQYGKYLWLDPGEQAVQDYSLAVIMDVVRRYDIDGVHLDDYFYPYTERDGYNKTIDFPDDTSWGKYVQSGGQLSRDDWRRENINTFVEHLYQAIKIEKSWVKFGISPFGIWRPGYPAQIKGFDAYEGLYADARKWLENGWLDYLSPQLYWKSEQTAQSYPVLLSWWVEQNTKGRHIWPGNFTSRVGNNSAKAWSAQEILSQIQVTRGTLGATGNVHYSMKPLMHNRGGISDLLEKDLYSRSALIPTSPWLENTAPSKPSLIARQDALSGKIQLSWQSTDTQKVWLWVIQTRTGSEWTTKVLPGGQTSYVLSRSDSGVESVAIRAVNRYESQGQPAVVELTGH